MFFTKIVEVKCPVIAWVDSSNKELKMNGCLARGRSREKDQGNSGPFHLEVFVPTDAEKENDLQSDDPEQQSEASMVTGFHLPASFSLS